MFSSQPSSKESGSGSATEQRSSRRELETIQVLVVDLEGDESKDFGVSRHGRDHDKDQGKDQDYVWIDDGSTEMMPFDPDDYEASMREMRWSSL